MVSPRSAVHDADRVLPRTLEADLPRVIDSMVRHIREQVTEYRVDPTGQVHAEAARAVRAAVAAFADSISGAAGPTQYQDVFRRLGRIEAHAGRSHDTLQAAYRVATQQVVVWLYEREAVLGMCREARARIEADVIAFITDLARLSAEGFAEVRRERAGVLEARDRLLAMLLRPETPSRRSLTALADRAGWQIPPRVQAVEFAPERRFEAAVLQAAGERLGTGGFIGRVANRSVAVIDAAADLDDLRAVIPTTSTMIVGPPVAAPELRISVKIAYRAARRVTGPGRHGAVVRCADHLLDLMGQGASEVMTVLAGSRLQPLLQLSLDKRIKLGRLLSAWLEHGTLHADVPGVLDKSRHTLHYQTSQLEMLFGDALHHGDARLELMLALRVALPRWEIERAAASRRRNEGSEPPAGAANRDATQPA